MRNKAISLSLSMGFLYLFVFYFYLLPIYSFHLDVVLVTGAIY